MNINKRKYEFYLFFRYFVLDEQWYLLCVLFVDVKSFVLETYFFFKCFPDVTPAAYFVKLKAWFFFCKIIIYFIKIIKYLGNNDEIILYYEWYDID